MSQPISVDLPHNLGADEAKRRIEANLHSLGSKLPAGADVPPAWEGDQLGLEIAMLGQEVDARLDVCDASVRVTVLLPPALAFFGQAIEAGLRQGGAALLEDRTKRTSGDARRGGGPSARVSDTIRQRSPPTIRVERIVQRAAVEARVEADPERARQVDAGPVELGPVPAPVRALQIDDVVADRPEIADRAERGEGNADLLRAPGHARCGRAGQGRHRGREQGGADGQQHRLHGAGPSNRTAPLGRHGLNRA